MAQKKCPKCGEDNPSEAVMCWACYTPLTGAAVASAGAAPAPARAAATPARTPRSEEKEKKPISPGLVAALAIVLLIGLAVSLTQLRGFTPPPDEPPPILKDDEGYVIQRGGGANPAPAPPPTNTITGGATVAVPPPSAMPFQPVLLPNPRSEWGTMAIVPEQADLGPTQAAQLAAFTLRQYSKSQMQQWKRFYIFVFKDRETARVFSTYMRERNYAPLMNNDYEMLYKMGIWSNTLVRYEYRNQRESVLYPQRSPGSWWLDRNAGKV